MGSVGGAPAGGGAGSGEAFRGLEFLADLDGLRRVYFVVIRVYEPSLAVCGSTHIDRGAHKLLTVELEVAG